MHWRSLRLEVVSSSDELTDCFECRAKVVTAEPNCSTGQLRCRLAEVTLGAPRNSLYGLDRTEPRKSARRTLRNIEDVTRVEPPRGFGQALHASTEPMDHANQAGIPQISWLGGPHPFRSCLYGRTSPRLPPGRARTGRLRQRLPPREAGQGSPLDEG